MGVLGVVYTNLSYSVCLTVFFNEISIDSIYTLFLLWPGWHFLLLRVKFLIRKDAGFAFLFSGWLRVVYGLSGTVSCFFSVFFVLCSFPSLPVVYVNIDILTG